MRRQDVIDTLARHIDELHGMGVATLSLFGSVARDEARKDSDIDFLVEFARPVGLFGIGKVQHFLEVLFPGRKIDLVIPDGIYEELKEDILKEAIRAA